MGDEHVHELLLGLSIQIQDGKSSMTSGCGSIADVEKVCFCSMQKVFLNFFPRPKLA